MCVEVTNITRFCLIRRLPQMKEIELIQNTPSKCKEMQFDQTESSKAKIQCVALPQSCSIPDAEPVVEDSPSASKNQQQGINLVQKAALVVESKEDDRNAPDQSLKTSIPHAMATDIQGGVKIDDCPDRCNEQNCPPPAPLEIATKGMSKCWANAEVGPTDLYEKCERKQRRCSAIDRSDSMPPNEFIRKNGFARPLQAYQIASWVMFGLIIFCFFLIVIPVVPLAAQVALGIFFGGLALLVFSLSWKCTSTDPIDPAAFYTGEWERKNLPRSASLGALVGLDPRICDICGEVQDRSKHCRVCNKCVDVFDHHCMWINNCVGKANYKLFVTLLTSAALFLLTAVVAAGWIIIQEAVWQTAGPRWQKAYGWYNAPAFYFFAAILFITASPAFCLVTQLLLLHIYLIHHHQTTYDYITMRVEDEVEAVATKDPQSKRKYACTEWIVIDKKRLRTAKKRRKSLAQQISDVSNCAPVLDRKTTFDQQLRQHSRSLGIEVRTTDV